MLCKSRILVPDMVMVPSTLLQMRHNKDTCVFLRLALQFMARAWSRAASIPLTVFFIGFLSSANPTYFCQQLLLWLLRIDFLVPFCVILLHLLLCTSFVLLFLLFSALNIPSFQTAKLSLERFPYFKLVISLSSRVRFSRSLPHLSPSSFICTFHVKAGNLHT